LFFNIDIVLLHHVNDMFSSNVTFVLDVFLYTKQFCVVSGHSIMSEVSNKGQDIIYKISYNETFHSAPINF